MIAYKNVDYVIQFDEIDLDALAQGIAIHSNVLHYNERQPLFISLKSPEEIQQLMRKVDNYLVYSNEVELCVVHLENPGTAHRIYFRKDWFLVAIQKLVDGKKKDQMVRWNDSSDKIFLLAGNGSEAERFKICYGE